MTTPGNVTLRPAGPGDADAVADIWREGWRDGHLGRVPDEVAAARTPESFRVRAGKRVGDTVVAVVAGEVAGFVMVVGAEVEQVYVDRSHRGSGIAAILLGEAERIAARSGEERVWLAVVAGNERARRFYERQGWRDDGPFDYAAGGAGVPLTVPCHRYTKQVHRGG